MFRCFTPNNQSAHPTLPANRRNAIRKFKGVPPEFLNEILRIAPRTRKNPTPVNICYWTSNRRKTRAKKVPIDEAVNGFQYKIKINNFDWSKRLRQTPITNVYTFRVVFSVWFSII